MCFSHVLIHLHKLHVNYRTMYVTFYIIKVRLYFDISVKIVRVQINKCVERNSLLDDIFGTYIAREDTAAVDSNERDVWYSCAV